MNNDFHILPSGDSAVTIYFRQEISEKVHNQVYRFTQFLEKSRLNGVIEWVPAYASLTIYYDPIKISFSILLDHVERILQKPLEEVDFEKPRLIEIPTLYGDEWGIDLSDVAKHNHLEIDEVIKIHSSAIYRVYMLGFAPGFPYLGGMSARISTPRLQQPRMTIPAGAVGIAGNQTGIYPLATPAGWRIIGRTPIKLFTPDQVEGPFLLKAGDIVKFIPIDKKDFVKMEL